MPRYTQYMKWPKIDIGNFADYIVYNRQHHENIHILHIYPSIGRLIKKPAVSRSSNKDWGIPFNKYTLHVYDHLFRTKYLLILKNNIKLPRVAPFKEIWNWWQISPFTLGLTFIRDQARDVVFLYYVEKTWINWQLLSIQFHFY